MKYTIIAEDGDYKATQYVETKLPVSELNVEPVNALIEPRSSEDQEYWRIFKEYLLNEI